MGFMWLFSLLIVMIISFKLGRKYQDFADLMLARRVSKLISQREQIRKEQEEWNKEMEVKEVYYS